MAIKDRPTLKSYFQTGDKPNQAQFEDLLDSVRLKGEPIPANDVATIFNSVPLVDGAAIPWDTSLGNMATITLASGTGTKTLTMSNLTANRFYLVFITRDGTGGAITINLPAGSIVGDGGAGTVQPSTGANAKDMLAGFYDGTNIWWNISKNHN